MQDNYEAPVVGNISVDIGLATAIGEFLLMFLKMPDAPLTGAQIKQFSDFRDVVKAGPTNAHRYEEKTSILRDGIKLGSGPKCLIDRHVALKYLRGMIHGDLTEEQIKYFQVGLLDALASHGPKKNAGINGKVCDSVFGYVDPAEAAIYLSGRQNQITVHRGKAADRQFATYFAETPNTFLRPDKAVWRGGKDHTKTKFTEEESKNQ